MLAMRGPSPVPVISRSTTFSDALAAHPLVFSRVMKLSSVRTPRPQVASRCTNVPGDDETTRAHDVGRPQNNNQANTSVLRASNGVRWYNGLPPPFAYFYSQTNSSNGKCTTCAAAVLEHAHVY